MSSPQARAQALYAEFANLYAEDPEYRAIPRGHIWGDGGSNMNFLRQSLFPEPQRATPLPPAVVDMSRNDQAIIARSIELSIAWYENHFAARGVRLADFPPGVLPTAESKAAAIKHCYPVAALGRYEHFHTTLLLEQYGLGPPKPAATAKSTLYVEIGAIYGALAKILIPRHPELTYVFVDLPESLCITYREILPAFPNAKIFVATKRGDVTNLDFRNYDIVFVPAILNEELASHEIDVFAGFHTFGEMSNKYISHYFRAINEKLRPRVFVSRNRYLSFIMPKAFHRLAENMASVLCDDRWTIEHWEVEPEILKCPYVDTRRHPRYAEFVLTRAEPRPESVERAAKQETLANIMVEGWVEIVSLFNNMLVLGHNQLRHETSKSGTLFRLWDSIRRCPGRDNVLVMVNYLDYLSGSTTQFAEEWFFYAGLLKRLHEAAPDSTSPEILRWLGARMRSEIKAIYAPSPGFKLGATILEEPLPRDQVRSMMYAMADVDLAALSSPLPVPRPQQAKHDEASPVSSNNRGGDSVLKRVLAGFTRRP